MGDVDESARAKRAAFESWMLNDEKWIVGSSDLYAKNGEESRWRCWQAAWSAARAEGIAEGRRLERERCARVAGDVRCPAGALCGWAAERAIRAAQDEPAQQQPAPAGGEDERDG